MARCLANFRRWLANMIGGQSGGRRGRGRGGPRPAPGRPFTPPRGGGARPPYRPRSRGGWGRWIVLLALVALAAWFIGSGNALSLVTALGNTAQALLVAVAQVLTNLIVMAIMLYVLWKLLELFTGGFSGPSGKKGGKK